MNCCNLMRSIRISNLDYFIFPTARLPLPSVPTSEKSENPLFISSWSSPFFLDFFLKRVLLDAQLLGEFGSLWISLWTHHNEIKSKKMSIFSKKPDPSCEEEIKKRKKKKKEKFLGIWNHKKKSKTIRERKRFYPKWSEKALFFGRFSVFILLKLFVSFFHSQKHTF